MVCVLEAWLDTNKIIEVPRIYPSGLRLNDGQALTSGLGLDYLNLAWPAVVQLVVSFNLARSGFWFSQEYFSLFYHGDQFDFCVFAMVH